MSELESDRLGSLPNSTVMGPSGLNSLVVVGLYLCLALACNMSLGADAAGATPAREIVITGPIGPATAQYVERSLPAAAKAGAPVIIVRIDTPGGLASSMRQIVKTILASSIPVVGYVGPSGARAASAGTYILYACDIAGMAPATNVGAATPVTLGPNGVPTGHRKHPKNNKPNTGTSRNANKSPADSQVAERRKIVNDSVAYIRSLAEKNGRNAKWAAHAVRAGASISAQSAKSKHVINLIAPSETALLKRIDGRQLVVHGRHLTLHTADLQIKRIRPSWRTRLLGFISQPTVALVFFVVGIVGLIGELFAPGTAVPGTIGALCLLTGLYGFHLLPVNYTGLGLVALGVGLMIAEAFAPSFGALGLGGVTAFIFGCLMLLNTSSAVFQISIVLIAIIAAGAAGIIVLTAILFGRARRARVHTAKDGMIGDECVAMRTFEQTGRVWLHGESWQARTTAPIQKNAPARVIAVSGLTVTITPMQEPTHKTFEGN